MRRTQVKSLSALCFVICLLGYLLIYAVLRSDEGVDYTSDSGEYFPGGQLESESCCQGFKGVQLWGRLVNPGNPLKFDSANDCCMACRATCHNDGYGPCLCDTWMHCGDKESCGIKYGECWLKKQKYMLDPDWQEKDGEMWTSGFVFGNVEAIVKMNTNYGAARIKLLPDCAPRSYLYILELMTTSNCIGCKFYRAEERGKLWDSKGNHIKKASFGPPYGLIQGTLEAEGVAFKKLSSEKYSVIRRGSVAWVGSGPEFFVSLADHRELKKAYMIIGYVVPGDMKVFEKIATLPTIPNIWNHTSVLILEKPVSFRLQRDTE